MIDSAFTWCDKRFREVRQGPLGDRNHVIQRHPGSEAVLEDWRGLRHLGDQGDCYWNHAWPWSGCGLEGKAAWAFAWTPTAHQCRHCIQHSSATYRTALSDVMAETSENRFLQLFSSPCTCLHVAVPCSVLPDWAPPTALWCALGGILLTGLCCGSLQSWHINSKRKINVSPSATLPVHS